MERNQSCAEAMDKNVLLMTERSSVEIDNNTCVGFQPGAHWKLLEPNEDTIDESIMVG